MGDASRDSRLVIPSAKPTDSGEYRVVISNEYGSVTSSPPAMVLVGPAPAANEVDALGSAPIPLAMRQPIVQVRGGDTHLLTLDSSGTVKGIYLKGYSYSYFGEADVPAAATSNVVDIEAGRFSSAALKADGSVIRWGARWVPDSSKPDGVSLKTDTVQTRSGRVRTIRGGGNAVAIGIHGEVLFWDESLADYSADGVPNALQSGVKEINRLFALKEDGTVISLSGAPVPAEAASGMAHLVESLGDGNFAVRDFLSPAAGIKLDGRVITWLGDSVRYLPTQLPQVVRLVSIEDSSLGGSPKDLIAIGSDGRAESVWNSGSGVVALPAEWQGRIVDLAPDGHLSGLGVVALFKPAPGWVRVRSTYDGNLSFALNTLSLRGLPLSTVVLDGPASLINGAVVFSRPGTATVRVSEANLLNPEDVTSYTTTLAVTRKEQQLTVAALDGLKVGDPALPIVAQSSSGLPVAFSQQESGLLLVNGTVRAARAGVFHLVVDQPGDSQFLPAPTVVQTVQVVPGISLTRSGAGAAAGVVLQIWAGDGQSADVQQSTNQVDWTLVAAVKGLGPDKPLTVSLPSESPGQTARYWRVVVTEW